MGLPPVFVAGIDRTALMLACRAQKARHESIVLRQRSEAAFREAALLRPVIVEVNENESMIEQAKGIVMGNRRCDALEAYRCLVVACESEELSLEDLARQITLQVDENRLHSV